MAVGTIPFECVQRVLRTWDLNNNSYRFRRTLRRVAHVLRQKKNLALFNRYIQRRFPWRFHDSKNNIALQLIEKFFRRIVVVVAPLVWTAHDRYHQLTVFPDLRISYRRLELLLIFLDPGLKVESLQILDGRHSSLLFPRLVSRCLDLNQQVWMRQLMHGDRRSRGTVVSKNSPYTSL